MTADQGQPPNVRPGAVAAGAVLLAVGGAMLLDTMGFVSINPGRLIGPFVLIALGTTMLLGARSCAPQAGMVADARTRHGGRQGMFGGIWLIGLGCWLLISQTGMFGLDFGTSWPLLLILMGALMVLRGWR